MRLGQFAVAFVLAGAVALSAAPAGAQQPQKQKKQRVYSNRDHTVFVSRDENGRTRTKIIVQKRSYLDPGTEPLASERSTLDYVQNPDQRAASVLNNTIGTIGDSGLPGPFDLPSSHNPWIRF